KTKKYRLLLQHSKRQVPLAGLAELHFGDRPGNTLDQRQYYVYLHRLVLVSGTLRDFYELTMTAHDPGRFLFRSLRLSTFINRQRTNRKLISILDVRFGQNSVYIIGNLSALHTWYHEPIRGKGFRSFLRAHEF
ncbi:hypothetical protein BX666DRAFT_1844207, partial [Dichotomocladium elegans]